MSDYSLDIPPDWNWIEFEKIKEPEPKLSPFLEKIGQTGFWGCTAFATHSFYQSYQKKKKATFSSPLSAREITVQDTSMLSDSEVLSPLSPPKSPSLEKQEIPKPFSPPLELAPATQSFAPPNPTFADLPCPDSDQKKIRFVIETIGKNGIFRIGLKTTQLLKVQEEILYLHPFRFLWTIFSQKDLKELVRDQVFEASPTGYFRKQGFMGGVNRGMSRELKNLDPYIKEFAESVGTTAEVLTLLIAKLAPYIDQGKTQELKNLDPYIKEFARSLETTAEVIAPLIAKLAPYIEGFAKSLGTTAEAIAPLIGNLAPYIKEFAESVGTTAEAITPLIAKGAQASDWIDLVQHLCQIDLLQTAKKSLA